MLMLTIACRCRCYDHEQYRHHAVILSSIVDSKEREMWKRLRGGQSFSLVYISFRMRFRVAIKMGECQWVSVSGCA